MGVRVQGLQRLSFTASYAASRVQGVVLGVRLCPVRADT